MARESIGAALGATLVLLVLLVFQADAAPAGAQITDLPGIDPSLVTFDQYAGYVNITADKHLFYWFVESQRDPANDPVLLWMNGGPGASSLLGFFSEHGPFRPDPNGVDLSLYPYAWNRIANVIYLEAPVGVGFSYSDNRHDYITNDTQTALDNYAFLEGWFELFPEFLSNPFWITGESYAGHYCPQLAAVLLEHLQDGSSDINMKGLLVGNPVTDNDWYYRQNEWSYLTTLYTHGLVPQSCYVSTYEACGWADFLKPDYCEDQFNEPSLLCREQVAACLAYYPYPDMDQYDLYAPKCKNETTSGSSAALEQFPAPANVPFYPCIDNFMISYLNQPAVQTALHVQPTDWYMYGKILYINETALVMPLYQQFQQETDWDVLIFSGDVDSAVPYLGTQRWVSCLGFPIKQDWTAWFYEEQVSGAFTVYDGLTLLSIKGCGHMLPYYCPIKGFVVLDRWFKGDWL